MVWTAGWAVVVPIRTTNIEVKSVFYDKKWGLFPDGLLVALSLGCMKTKTHIYKLGLSIFVAVLSIVACKKKDDANSAQTPTYQYIGGVCYSSDNQQVPAQYCQQNGGNNGYYLQNGQCYSSQGQPAAIQMCNQNGNGGIGGQQCYGSYIYQSGYWTNMMYCNGANCRGYTLTEVSTNRTVTCQ